MGRWLKKLRGLVGFSSIGAVIGALFGGLWSIVATLATGGSVTVAGVLLAASIYGAYAAVATAGVGVLIAVVGSGRTLVELRAWPAGLCGAVLGAAGSVLFLFLSSSGLPVPVFTSVALRFGLLGGALGAGLVAVAKRSAVRLSEPRSDAVLSAMTEPDGRELPRG